MGRQLNELFSKSISPSSKGVADVGGFVPIANPSPILEVVDGQETAQRQNGSVLKLSGDPGKRREILMQKSAFFKQVSTRQPPPL